MTITRRLLTVVALSAVAFGGATPAMAATSHGAPAPKHSTKHVTKHVVKKTAKKKVTKKPAAKKPAVKPTSVPTVSAPASVTDASLSTYEARLLVDVNKARATAGLPALKAVNGLTDVARDWTLQLASDDSLSHNPSLVKDLTASGAQAWHSIAENVGMASGSNADDVFAAYMASPMHKANILSASARYIGIGAVQTSDAAGPITWNTMDFTDSYDGSYGAAHTSIVGDLLDATGVTALAASWGVTLV